MQFRDKYWFLSNMYPCSVKVGDHTYKCAEAAFQAQKCFDEDIKKQFETLDGFSAKKLGRTVTLRHDWEKVKDSIMYVVVRCKFQQHPDLLEQLKEIKEPLQEDNDWHDTYWGVCNGVGQNKLGKILFLVREII